MITTGDTQMRLLFCQFLLIEYQLDFVPWTLTLNAAVKVRRLQLVPFFLASGSQGVHCEKKSENADNLQKKNIKQNWEEPS